MSTRTRFAELAPVELSTASGPTLYGELSVPEGATGLVLFAHGSGSSRHSPRNQFVAHVLRDAGLGTLLFDLLTTEEEEADQYTAHLRFDITLLSDRLVQATEWAQSREELRHLRLGYFGSSTGGGAALVAAGEAGETIGAVVSRGGRPDLAGESLRHVVSPTLLIVGELDEPVIRLNEEAYDWMACEKDLVIIPGATHLFEEPGALEHVARLAAHWFQEHLQPL
jgi:putative phosphoribosyl transferase